MRRRQTRRLLENEPLWPRPHPAPATQAPQHCRPRHLLHGPRKLRRLLLIPTLNSQFNSFKHIIVEVGRGRCARGGGGAPEHARPTILSTTQAGPQLCPQLRPQLCPHFRPLISGQKCGQSCGQNCGPTREKSGPNATETDPEQYAISGGPLRFDCLARAPDQTTLGKRTPVPEPPPSPCSTGTRPLPAAPPAPPVA